MMSLRAWLHPRYQLLACFVLITLVPSVLLIVFGWRSFQQERSMGLQRLQERMAQAADLAVSRLQQELSAVERQLEDAAGIRSVSPADDAVAVVFSLEGVETVPENRLVFYPYTVAGSDAPAETFASGEGLEFGARDHEAAASIYRDLTHSAAPSVRAGALIRLARILRSDGEWEAARAAYARVIDLRGVAVAGVPADLLARWAICDLLAAGGRQAELRQQADALYADLSAGRWHLDRSMYTVHVRDAMRWAGGPADEAPAASDLALSAGVAWLWRAWREMPGSGASGSDASDRVALELDGRRLTVLWRRTGEQLTALVAGPTFVERRWLQTLTPLLERQHARLVLGGGAAPPASPGAVRRVPAETGLPWTVAVESLDVDAELNQLAARRRVWMAGLTMLVLLVLSGSYIIARAVIRELAVARLQSDFVAAVSHEFRTPLTLLRQLTEILTDGRAASAERRQAYYQALARQTERLRQLVESLLDFGRMEAGTSPYRLEPLDGCLLVRTVVHQFEHEAATRGCHVELSSDGVATAVIAGDREALTNALWNLLDNAVKYSPDCHTVWVRVAREEGLLAISVRDQGIGIPHDEQQAIFAKFVRGATAKAQNIAGTGIGLAMVHHILKAHGGAIRLDSIPGAGSTFTMLLPLKEPGCES